MLSTEVMKYLHDELSRDDPWGLEHSAFEQARYSAMRGLVGPELRYESGLEVGCATGLFTKFLSDRCNRLRVVDVLPEAIRRCRDRLGNQDHVHFSVADIGRCRGWRERYDLIVVGEVLYFLGARRNVARAITKLKRWLRPDGTVLFCSARDAVSARWGMPCGAETAMWEWGADLLEVGKVEVRGSTADENCIVAQYRAFGEA
jgi:SAM-dependent methyltransferase